MVVERGNEMQIIRQNPGRYSVGEHEVVRSKDGKWDVFFRKWTGKSGANAYEDILVSVAHTDIIGAFDYIQERRGRADKAVW